MAVMKKAVAKKARGLNNLAPGIKPKTTAEKVLGVDGVKAKYFEAKSDAKKYPKSAQAKRQLADRSRTLSRADAILNREMAKAKAKKAAASPMKTSAASHQRDLAKVAGSVAARNKANAMAKAKQKMGVLDATGAAKTKAERRTLKSFK
jgi:hypothetical protein